MVLAQMRRRPLSAATHPFPPSLRRSFQILALGGGIGFDDINSMRVWDVQPGLCYDIGGTGAPSSAPPHMKEGLLQDLSRDLLAAPHGYVLQSSDPQHAAKLDVLTLLQEHNCVCQSEPGGECWSLTGPGLKSLQLSSRLNLRGMALRPRPNVADVDKNIFELLWVMCDRGWVCMVKLPVLQKGKQTRPGVAAASSDERTPLPTPATPFESDGAIIWWVQPGQNNYLPGIPALLVDGRVAHVAG